MATLPPFPAFTGRGTPPKLEYFPGGRVWCIVLAEDDMRRSTCKMQWTPENVPIRVTFPNHEDKELTARLGLSSAAQRWCHPRLRADPLGHGPAAFADGLCLR